MCELLQNSPTFFVSFFKVKKVQLRAVLACAESNFSNFKFEYLREKEFFKKNHFSLFIRGPDGFDS